MTVIRRRPRDDPCQRTALTFIGAIFLFLCIYVANLEDVVTSKPPETRRQQVAQQLRHSVVQTRHQISQALLHKRKQFTQKLSSIAHRSISIPRLQKLREKHEVVGEHLSLIQSGSETVQEVLRRGGSSNEPPLSVKEILSYLDEWIHELHNSLARHKQETFLEVWQAYHDLVVQTLFPWDQDYLRRMPERRQDGSIFLSVASYRDENCPSTLMWAYGNATSPEKLFVGLVQQNCRANCRSGVLEGGKVEDVEPDIDCYQEFCQAYPQYCGNIRHLFIEESESLGPYAARFFASKLWYGESWYMQTDAHMTFIQDWDSISVRMLLAAPTAKPVISHYPPSHDTNLTQIAKEPCSRLCGPVFACSEIEAQIIRLEGAAKYDKVQLPTPRFAPFTAAGYMVAHSDFLREIPFDPFLPWIFMGEEIIMSARLWTAGYDMFSPVQAVCGHIYVRRHKPKFWESVNRALHPGIINPLKGMILNRIKHQLGYPESAMDILAPKSLLTAVEYYSMGKERSLDEYLRIVGLNMTTKEVTLTHWCEEGAPPPGFERYAHLYH